MEKRGKFFLTFGAGVLALGFIISGLSAPALMVFELKPYARIVLRYGNLANWTAADLNLDKDKYERVKENYDLFRKNTGETGSSSDSSDIDGTSESSDSDEIGQGGMLDKIGAAGQLATSHMRTGGQEAEANYTIPVNTGYDDSSSSEGESSESIEMTLEDRLQGVPIDQSIKLGLFVSKVCSVSQDRQDTCINVPLLTGMEEVFDASQFAEKELTMQFWNNVRMESIFSLLACVGGMICVLATLKPCCHVDETPVYLGALSYLASAVLAVTPIIRISLISADLTESLETEMNVTTELRMPWALVLSGMGGALSIIALLLLIFGRVGKMTHRLYTMLSPRGEPSNTNGNAMMLHRVGDNIKKSDSGKELSLYE